MIARHCSGVVLAGGASSRFGGGAKGLATVGGRRIVDRALEALRGATDEQFLITNDRSVAESLPDVSSFEDARHGRGSLIGLHSALTHCREAAVVVAWDMPFVSTALLSRLRRRGEARGRPAIPVGADGPEPLCAYYPRSCLAVIEQQLEAAEMRLSDLVSRLADAELVRPDELADLGAPDLLFMNVNSAADLVAARSFDAGASGRDAGLGTAFMPEHE